MAESGSPVPDWSVDHAVKDKLWASGGEGLTPEQTQEYYKTWAASYEQDMLSVNYIPQVMIAECLKGCFPGAEQRTTVKILDVGAGTGLVAKELRARGFVHIDALDANEEMLQMARSQGRYENYFQMYLTKEPSDIPENTYDALTGTGIFMEGGHMPSDVLYEMIRLVKPGGYIVLVLRVVLVEGVYKDLEPLMNQLEEGGRWKMLKRDVRRMYSDREGVVFTFQVL